MATIYGQSQAWQAVISKLNPRLSTIDSPHALRQLHERLERDRPQWQNNAEQAERHRITQLEAQLQTFPDRIAHQEQTARAQMGPTIARLERQYAALIAEPKFLRHLFNKWFVAPGVQSRLVRARSTLKNAANHLRAAQKSLARQIAAAHAAFPFTIRAMVQADAATFDSVCEALSSPEFAGAIMELEVARILAELPASFHVFHDRKLALRRSVQFQGKWLSSAQIDHLVVSPAGVFVIETKNWSREFVAHGSYFDPFEQVARARFLCQCFLRDAGLNHLVVHDILANAGAHLDKPQNSCTKIIRPGTLKAHLLNRPAELPAEMISVIVERLRRRLA